MKIIPSFLILATGLLASTFVRAQEQQLKAEIAKPLASTVPPPGTRPALAPDAKPASNISTLQKSEEALTVAPLPSTRKEEQIKAPEIKSTRIMTDEKLAITQPVLLPNENGKALPAPAVPKAKENQ